MKKYDNANGVDPRMEQPNLAGDIWRGFNTSDDGVENDFEVARALLWLATASGNISDFMARLAAAQQNYLKVIGCGAFLGKDLSWSDLGTDIVANYFAQGKSLLDNRHSYDMALAPHVVPWLKQLGANLPAVVRIEGVSARVQRMLRNCKVLPNSALFELVVASNYAMEGFDVAFIEEGPTKTPDLRLRDGAGYELFVELKYLQCSNYQIDEQRRHREIFSKLEPYLYERSISVDVDVKYEKVLFDVPIDYLLQRVERAIACSTFISNGYVWQDEFGSGLIRTANLQAVRRDTRDSFLYFGTKMARLLSGRSVTENNYHLVVEALASPTDPRYVDRIRFASVLTWHCVAPESITRKAKYVRSKIAEADRQIVGYGRGIVHIAMDTELHSESSDLRRHSNRSTLETFQMESETAIVHLHYLVPRISESHSWLMDETVDMFSRLDHPPPPFPVFTNSIGLDNDEPAWWQQL